jgi:TATA-binding protein-associated factor
VNQDNSSVRTMETDQLLDLFTISDEQNGKINNEAVDGFGNLKKSKSKVKAMLDEMGDLWDESQYDFDLNNFLGSLSDQKKA